MMKLQFLNYYKNRRGQLLIEAMMAIGFITVGILSVLALLSRSLALNRVVADQYTAAYLAMEGVEIVKNIIDTNIIRGRPWNDGLSNGNFEVDYSSTTLVPYQGRLLQINPATGLFGYSGGDQTNYLRGIEITLVSPDEVRVNSMVTWQTHGSGLFSLNVEDHFFNWRPSD